MRLQSWVLAQLGWLCALESVAYHLWTWLSFWELEGVHPLAEMGASF